MPRLRGFDQVLLARAVKVVCKLGLRAEQGTWKEYLKTLSSKNRLADPARHEKQELLIFLKGLLPTAAVPKPKQLVKRILQWQRALKEESAALGPGHLLVSNPGASAATPGSNSRKRDRSSTDAEGPGMDPLWALVQRTKAHAHFAKFYDFPSWQKGWQRTSRLPPPDLTKRPRLLGIDCEMCATSSSDKELLAVAVVDEHGTTLLRELVQPSGTILDLRTSITGVTLQQLEGVSLTRQQLLSEHLLPLLGPDVVLVGHALHNDLAALQLDHQPVIDTSLLFRYKGLPWAAPPLVLLAQQLLSKSLRGSSGREGVHDSTEDAAAAVALVLKEAQQQEPTPPLTPPAIKVQPELLRQLLVHRLPKGTTAAAVFNALAAVAPDAPKPLQLLEEGMAGGRLGLVFKHPGEAEALFQAVPGEQYTDSVGRRTKQLKLASGAVVAVRKNACHNGLAFGKELAKDRGARKRKREGKRKAPQGQGAKAAAAEREGKCEAPKGQGAKAAAEPEGKKKMAKVAPK